MELESCNDKEVTLTTDDPVSVDKILQLEKPLIMSLMVHNITNNATKNNFEVFIYEYSYIKTEQYNKIILLNQNGGQKGIKISSFENDLFKVSFHKNYVEFKITPRFRTGDICGVKEKFNIQFSFLYYKGLDGKMASPD